MMFGGCSNLEELDLSNFDTSNVGSMNWMFDGCHKLNTVKVGSTFGFKNGMECRLPGETWYSANDRRSYTSNEIALQRSYVADTYTTTPSMAIPGTNQTMFRLYNPNSGEHFYTASAIERDAVIDAGWNDEGTGWIAPTGGDPVYRLYNQYAGEHHYTTSVVERDMLVSVGWNDEGIGWYAGGERPLYRLYNPNAYANNHHYSTDVGERDILISIGWQDEGIAWYGVG